MSANLPDASIPELENRLAAARLRCDRAQAALAAKHRGGEWEEYAAATAELLAAERRLAAAQGEEYAEPLDFPVRWSPGAPLPHVIADDHRTLLVFLVDQPDPNWDGTYATLKNPADGKSEPLALVEFVRCASMKFGTPNDEVFSGHPLYGRGLDGYTAQVVRNSRWLAELERINSVHTMYRPESWRARKHFVFWFHDSTFECVAESYKVELFEESFADVLARACRRLVS